MVFNDMPVLSLKQIFFLGGGVHFGSLWKLNIKMAPYNFYLHCYLRVNMHRLKWALFVTTMEKRRKRRKGERHQSVFKHYTFLSWLGILRGGGMRVVFCERQCSVNFTERDFFEELLVVFSSGKPGCKRWEGRQGSVCN